MKRLEVFGGSLGYREDLMIPTFHFPVGHSGRDSLGEVDIVSMD